MGTALRGILRQSDHAIVARRLWLGGLVVTTLVAAAPHSAVAAERYALVVTGASGGPEYGAKYQAWRAAFLQTLKETFGYPDDHVRVLGEDLDAASKSTRENVRAALADWRKRLTDDDMALVLLIGHGASDGDEAKFNLVGPDLDLAEWAALIKPLAGRIVFVNASSGSFPFLAALAGRNRVVLTANDSAAQQFETVFPEYFVKAFGDEAADTDKNGKVSLLEAFAFASANVKEWFEQKGQLATERALIDDTGAGVGRDADTPGRDGQIAQITYLQPEVPPELASNPELAALMRRRADVENQLAVLKSNKERTPIERYEDELERLLLELARIDRQLRSKT
jgi:hypothetical protein